ncbi:MAG: SAM-dependent methyltransferase [Actinomycetes bacterium]
MSDTTTPDDLTVARPVPGSFRDPAGVVYTRDGLLLRQVDRSFAETYDAVVASGLYDALHQRGLLVRHDEVPAEEQDALALDPARAHRVLRPERVPFVSYPYEWSPGMRRAAALATLDAMSVALDHGMVLRDASAFNVVFLRGRAVLIDTLSFGPREPDAPWAAYHQFCRHFLAPLALECTVDVRLGALTRTDVAGVPLDLAATMLPASTKLRPALLTHLHLQARAQRDREVAVDGAGGERRTVRFSDTAMRGLVEQLRGAVAKLTWEPAGTTWADYYETAAHYSDEAMASKVAGVGAFLDAVAPTTVWDLGANTGRFALLAAERGAHVVAADIDHGAVERGWRARTGADWPDVPGDVHPLLLDLGNPSPALGWALTERPSIVDRGPADAVLALALVHHLAIAGEVPLPRVVDLLASLGRDVLVEWVPKDDPKVRVLLATREDRFDGYTTEDFLAACASRGEVVSTTPVAGTDRLLVHLRP